MGATYGCHACSEWKKRKGEDKGEEPPEVQQDIMGVPLLPQEDGVMRDGVKENDEEYVIPSGSQLAVMLFGMTGTGKSSLGNLIAGSSVFSSADTSRSVTTHSSVLKYEAEDRSLCVLDTIGLGDTEISQDVVCKNIYDVAVSAPNGVDILLYIMRLGRITDDTVLRLIYLTQYLWGDESLQNLYIVVTWSGRYLENAEASTAWINQQVEADSRFKHIFMLAGSNPNRFIFVDNPPLDDGERWQHEVQEKRKLSHTALLRCFSQHDRNIVPPFTQQLSKQLINIHAHKEQNHLEAKHQELARIQTELRLHSASVKAQEESLEFDKQQDEAARLAEAALLAQEEAQAKQDQIFGFKNLMRQASKDQSTIKARAEAKEKEQKRKAAALALERAAAVKEESKGSDKDKSPKKQKAHKRSSREVSPRLPAPRLLRTESQERMEGMTQEKAKKEQLEKDLEQAKGEMLEAQTARDIELRKALLESTTLAQHAQKAEKLFKEDASKALLKDPRSVPPPRGRSTFGKVMSMGKKMLGGGLKSQQAPPTMEETLQILMSKSAQSLSAHHESGQACIIFDWDDTLCPTWWLRRVLMPRLCQVDSSTFKDEIHAYVSKMLELLRAARKVATVDILTQADSEWVSQSFQYLCISGIDVKEVLKELGITIYYADLEQAKEIPRGAGVDVLTMGKMIPMSRILQFRFGDSPTSQWNALSIGDKTTELLALRELCKEHAKKVWRRPICKTLKLPEHPLLEELVENFKAMILHLPRIVANESDLDLTASILEQLRAE